MSTRIHFEHQDLTTRRQKITLFFRHHPALWLSFALMALLMALPLEKETERKKGINEGKNTVQTALYQRFGKNDTSDLFSSLLLGTPLPTHLKALFKKTGLLHLVAISGFHFSLLRGYLFFLLGFFVQGRGRLYALLLFLGGYALLLGGLPSVLRAFFATAVALFCELTHRRSKPLNTFGASLLFTLIFDWKLMYQLSFQMSFGITYAILTLYPFLIERVSFPKIVEVRKETVGMQLFLVARTLFEKSLLFSLAVSSVAIPISLYAFGSFPSLSLLINLLFTPPLFSVGGWYSPFYAVALSRPLYLFFWRVLALSPQLF